MKREELANLLSFANEMRAAKGDSPLKDIPKSRRRIPSQCVIAKSFNYGCRVFPGAHGGLIIFNTLEDAQTYCKVVGIGVDDIYGEESLHIKQWVAPLTKELNDVAQRFDLGIYKEYEDLVGLMWNP